MTVFGWHAVIETDHDIRALFSASLVPLPAGKATFSLFPPDGRDSIARLRLYELSSAGMFILPPGVEKMHGILFRFLSCILGKIALLFNFYFYKGHFPVQHEADTIT